MRFLLARLRRVSCVLCAVATTTVWASGGPPMLTDDPSTPGDGHWEINVAGLANHIDQATTYQLPLLDINYGVGERLQLKLETPWLLQNDTRGSASGIGNGLAGVKWRFYDAGEMAWQVSTYPQIEFNYPFSGNNNKNLRDAGVDYLFPLEFVRGFDGFDINFDMGRWFRPRDQQDSWIGGAVITHELRKAWEIMAELHNERAVHLSQNELTFNVGTRYDISENRTILFSVGHDLHNSLSEPVKVMAYLGLQLRM